MNTPRQRLQAALDVSDPARALRSVVLELAAEGRSKRDIGVLLEELLAYVRGRQDRAESAEDAVLDALDALAGWCQENAQLLPEQ